MKRFFSLLLCLLCFQSSINLEASLTKRERTRHRYLLITGCARSGTTFISHFLQASGMDLPHEALGSDGSVSWPMAVDAKQSPWGPASHGIVFEHTFHQVRHPLKVISSVYVTEPLQSWRFICRNIKEISMRDPPLVRCAKYWVYWNLSAEKKAEWTYRIEDLENRLPEMAERLGRELSVEVLRTIPKDTNTRKPGKRQFTWKDLKRELDPELYSMVKDLAQRYGYNVEGA